MGQKLTTALGRAPQAKQFADGVHAKFPGKLLAYNCSPSFNWAKKLGEKDIAAFQQVPGCCVVLFTAWNFMSYLTY